MKTEEITQQAAKREALEAMNVKTESTANLKAAFSDSQQEYASLKQLNADLCYRLSQLEEELDSELDSELDDSDDESQTPNLRS